jgi:hypothetical protein
MARAEQAFFRLKMSILKKRFGSLRAQWSILAINITAKQPKSPDAAPAHILRIELSTRITTQRLHYRSGEEETAAESVHLLFPKVRELMSNHPDAKVFCQIGLRLLNQVLRPYTARWHGWMTESEGSAGVTARFRDERVRRMFRVELRELQARLVGYEKAFEALSEGVAVKPEWLEPDAATQDEILSSLNHSERCADLGDQPLIAGIDPDTPVWNQFGKAATVKQINEKEHGFILERREMRGGQNRANGGNVTDAIGLALSGGGIRSATVCLGVAQVLAEKKILGAVDYLSSVSGGGYFGTFLSSYLSQYGATHGVQRSSIDEFIDRTFKRSETGVEAVAVRHLRNNSKYLLHGGPWGKVKMAGLMLSGIAANLSMILPLPLFGALAIWFLNFLGFWGGPALSEKAIPLGSSASPVVRILGTLSLTLLVFWMVLLGTQRKAVREPLNSPWFKIRDVCSMVTLALAVVTFLLVVAAGIPKIFGTIYAILGVRIKIGRDLSSVFSEEVLLAIAGALPFLFGAATAFFKQPWIHKLMARMFILSGPLFYGSVALFVCKQLGLTTGTAKWPWWLILVIAVFWLIWSCRFIDINSLGPHGYYRDRLCECYLAWNGKNEQNLLQAAISKWWSGKKGSEEHQADDGLNSGPEKVGVRLRLPLSNIAYPAAAPYHLVNTIVNLPASKNQDLRGRNGDFFILSPYYCGSPVCGYAETSLLEKGDPHVDLGTAMAISGAAASTNMGWRTLTNIRFLMALLNIRLGYWIPNIRYLDRVKARGAGFGYFLAEITGRIQENMRYLNISDGGHIENLGVYELLRRRCKFIVCVHGGANLETEGGDLQRLERYAAIDLGIALQYNLSDLQPDTRKISRAYAILIKIIYPADEIGWMIYLKPALTGGEPQYVLDYRFRNSSFPFDGILNQVFEEEQFEAYRSVGESAAASLFDKELFDETPPGSVREWFQKLADNLLPDNDAAFARAASPTDPATQ